VLHGLDGPGGVAFQQQGQGNPLAGRAPGAGGGTVGRQDPAEMFDGGIGLMLDDRGDAQGHVFPSGDRRGVGIGRDAVGGLYRQVGLHRHGVGHGEHAVGLRVVGRGRDGLGEERNGRRRAAGGQGVDTAAIGGADARGLSAPGGEQKPRHGSRSRNEPFGGGHGVSPFAGSATRSRGLT